MFFVLKNYHDKDDQKSLFTASMFSIVISALLYIFITFLFFRIYSAVNAINKASLEFYVNNSCSNAILNYSYEQVLSKISNMSTYSLLGGLLTVVLLLLDVVATLDSLKIFHRLRHGSNSEDNYEEPFIA